MRGGGQTMWIIIKFYNIIIKSANVDKGGGVKRLSTKCGYKYFFIFLLNPSRNEMCNEKNLIRYFRSK